MKAFVFSLFLLLQALCCWAQLSGSNEFFVAKPYLQLGPQPSPTTLVVLWHTVDIEASWQVEYQTDVQSRWQSVQPELPVRVAVSGVAAHRVYKASLHNLKPNTTFGYRLKRNGAVVFTANGQAPRTADTPYRFVAFADIGAETTDQKKLAARAYLAKPDFVVVPGDIVYERGRIDEYRTKFWPMYNTDVVNEMGGPLLQSVPMIGAPGNHDTDTRDLDKYPDALAYFYYWSLPLNGPSIQAGSPLTPALVGSDENRQSFLSAAGQNFPRMGNYSFDYANAHWTIIDSNPYVDFTDTTVVNWVKRDLESAKQATWRFVMFHHPGFNSSREHYEQQHMRLLSPAFEAGKVDVVFSGHVHNYQRTYPMTFVPDRKGVLLVASMGAKMARGRVVNGRWTLDKAFDGKTNTRPNGVIYLVTGAGGQTLYNPEQNTDPDSWQKFTVTFYSNVHSLTVVDMNDRTMTVKQVDVNGKELDSFTITK